MKIKVINDQYFGSERTHRYVMHVYRECVEKLIVTNTLVEVWSRTKGAHKHAKGSNCSQCSIFFQIYHSCADSLFLHLRLLFSKEEPHLANALLGLIKELSIKDFEDYYMKQYDHQLTSQEVAAIEPLFSLTARNLPKLNQLYIKRIEPYQSFAFHQPDNGKYYKVQTVHKKGEGIKFITHTRKQKFKRDLAAAKDMLNLLADVIHAYLKLSSKYFHIPAIYPQNSIDEIANLLGVDIDEKTLEDLRNDARKHTEKMVHILECGGGLNSHNRLLFERIKTVSKPS